ncbi:toxic anion resistance protein [Campylobacter ureolyticus]|uniref:Toxic anion resistance family protein n=1 Tax=Campylobacter ureolyticus TaxID=827 RepID=A0AAE7JP15_9BACT|nr:toxic anion resistance protein [Campylobacter ureolyticus]MCR8683962.1 toxic anion resistance protein [Campylobacter ureolyticus]QKF83981.1 toxic anion resistance family protein [Campylobacter ureolyticus]QQY35871.1 toxic anion resistance protein [Campylobacter ureolyticus]SUX24320.1 Toxic anion resistance protein (TelA) [Campylobacter ureolyticus]
MNDLVISLKNQKIDYENLVFEDKIDEKLEDEILDKTVELLKKLTNKSEDEIRDILNIITSDEIDKLESSSVLLSNSLLSLEKIENNKTNSISKEILRLNDEFEKINPNNYNFKENKFLSFLPFITKPINRYLSKFKSVKESISSIISNLENSQKLLKEDNLALINDKKQYSEIAISLQRKSIVFKTLMQYLEKNLSNLQSDKKEFYEKSIILNLNKKLRSIYEILAVTRQGIFSTNLLINTNEELIENITNVKVVTKRAIEIGVSMAVCLENQKNVINAVNETKKFANEIILQNSNKMKDQSLEISQISGSSTLGLEVLKASFENIKEAINTMNLAKEQNLNKLRDEIKTFEELTKDFEEKIQKQEKENELKEKFKIGN